MRTGMNQGELDKRLAARTRRESETVGASLAAIVCTPMRE